MKVNERFVLKQEETEFYRRNGYLVAENILTSEECDIILGIFELHADREFSPIVNLDRKVPEIRSLIKHPKMVFIVETLQNVEVVGLQTVLHFKRVNTPGAEEAWNPHQDNTYQQTGYGLSVAGDIALADQNKENGCLYVYSGSHIEPILPYEKVGNNVGIKNPGNRVLQIPEKYQKVDLCIKKGSGLFLHSHVIHGSYPNISMVQSRPILLMLYINKGAKFSSGFRGARIPIPLHDE